MAANIIPADAEMDAVRRLSRLSPAKSIGIVGMEWAIILLAASLPVLLNMPWLFVCSWLLIGTRMYALYSLLHDGTHYLIFPDKRINDLISKLFLAWPLFISLQTMRANHFAHHKYLKTARDPEQDHLQYPEFKFPQKKLSLFWTILKDLTGFNFIKYKLIGLRSGKITDLKNISLWRYVYYLSILAMVFYFEWHLYFLVCWILPYATVYQLLNRIRAYSEHLNLPENSTYQTRSLLLGPIQRFFLAPHNLGLHAEHHYYPSVPFYNLDKLHAILLKNPGFTKQATFSEQYLSTLKYMTNE